MKSKTARVIVADESPPFRQALRQSIESDTRFQVVADIDQTRHALGIILHEGPEFTVLDAHLPQMPGLELAAALKVRKSPSQFVLLTQIRNEQLFNQALNLGVNGYVLKENAEVEIRDCLGALLANNSYVSPALTDFLLRRHHRAEFLANKRPGLENLTIAERRVLKYIARGRTSKEIAAEFFISPRTVESHRANICTKLKLVGSNRLVRFAIENRDALSRLD